MSSMTALTGRVSETDVSLEYIVLIEELHK